MPVGAGLMGGQLAILLSAAGWEVGMVIGLFMALAGWTSGLVILGKLVADERGCTWHARSCYAALVFGYIGLLAFLAFVPVSYTHLDVYKRQFQPSRKSQARNAAAVGG